jgi:hypothetical protein
MGTDAGDWSDCASVSDVPETHYARSADGTHLAYHVSGDGPLDLVFATGNLAEPGQVLVSDAVRSHLVGSGVEFRDRGEHQLKGVPGTWLLYAPED